MQTSLSFEEMKSQKKSAAKLQHTIPLIEYLKWILMILKSIGLIPFFTILNRTEITAPGINWKLLSKLIICVKCLLNLVHIYVVLSPTLLKIFFSVSKTDGVSNILDVLFCMVSDVTITWTCVCHGAKVIEILNRFLKIDQQLTRDPQLAWCKSYTKNPFNWYIILVICYIFYVMLPLVTRGANTISPFFLHIVYLMTYQLENTVSCMFVIFISALMRLLANRFQTINQLLEHYNSNSLSSSQCAYESVDIWPAIRVRAACGRLLGPNDWSMAHFVDNSKLIYRLHNDLLELFKMINNYAGLGLLTFLLYSCYGLLSCVYNTFLFDWQEDDNIFNIVWTLSWIPLFAGILIILTTNCNVATKEANKTSKVLSRIYGNNTENQNVVDTFLLKNIKYDIQFTAYGFFVIDNSTLFKVFSAVTTYLVILIQFKQLEDSKAN